jgi:hypothetical protein
MPLDEKPGEIHTEETGIENFSGSKDFFRIFMASIVVRMGREWRCGKVGQRDICFGEVRLDILVVKGRKGRPS